MNRYIWIFPVLFMFHDMEEVVGIKPWLEKNMDEITSRFPAAKKLLSAYKGITTEGFALAVYEELIVLMVVCALFEITGAEFVRGIWFGGLIGFTLHLVIHIFQAAAIRRYIPALVTSVLSLPPSILLLMHSYQPMKLAAIAGAVLGAVGVGANLKLAHKIMRRYSAKLK